MPLLAGWVLGAAWQVTQPGLHGLAAYQMLMLVGGLALLLARRWRDGRRPALICALLWGAALLAAGGTGWRAHFMVAHGLEPALEGRDLRIEGMIASMLQPTAQGQRWRMEVESARADGEEQAVPRWIDLAWYAPRGGPGDERPPARDLAPWAGGLALAPGQRWAMTIRVKRPHGARNPHGFDFELQQWEQGVRAVGYVREVPAPQFIEATPRFAVQRWRQWLRDRIHAQADGLRERMRGLDEASVRRALGVVAALAVGDQQAIVREDWNVFRATGVAHLMSISGLHITMFAWLAALVVARLWRLSAAACRWLPAQRAALLAGVTLAAFYALFSGWGLPAQRTVCMLAVAAGLQYLGVRWPWHMVWALALAVVVAFDPWALWQAGFWLSFVAVGVLLACGGLAMQGGERAGAGTGARIASRALALWREQWLISLALAPLGLLLFGQFSLAGLLANLLAIPWVTLLVTPLALAAVLWPAAAGWSALCLLPLMELLQWLAGFGWAAWTVPAAPWWAAMAAIAGGLLLVAPVPGAWRWLGAACCLPALFWPVARPPEGHFELLAADIGQGNAVLLRTHGHSLLYDAGPQYGPDSDAGGRVLVPLLQSLGVRLDMLMLSHRDLDHTGGALAVKAAQPWVAVWGSDSVLGDEALAGLRPVRRCAAGQRWRWDGVEFAVLHPAAQAGQAAPEAGATRQSLKPNAGSCVLHVRAANGAMALLPGDIEAPQEQGLVRAGTLAPVQWLLVPHHGSRTSSSPAWVQALRPRWAVVQAGYRNRFGHPVPDVMHRYEDVGTQMVQNDSCGAASWSSWQPDQMRCERQQRLRYWDAFAVRTPPQGAR